MFYSQALSIFGGSQRFDCRKRRVNCETLSTLYVKANGEVVCDDDAGNGVSLGALDRLQVGESLAGILENERFARIRARLAAGRMPWPGICERCAFLRPDEVFADRLAGKQIDKLQIEPSLSCNVACPECRVHEQAKERPGTRHLPPELLGRFLADLRHSGYRLREMEYCGHGEPLAHPLFAELCRVTRAIFPLARQRLITNGNFDYARKVGLTPLEEVFVSCDGARQASYAQYRIGGNIERVFGFMREAVKAARDAQGAVVWKYILFAHNDSDEEIVEAQELAQAIGISTLLFVFTHTRQRSLRYRMENAAAVPRLYPNVTVNAHPSFYREVKPLRLATPWTPVEGDPRIRFCIDEVTLYRREHITLSGWAFGQPDVTAIEVIGPQGNSALVRAQISRPDVAQAFSECRALRSGFWANLPVSAADPERPMPLRLILHRKGEDVVSLGATYVV